MRVAICAAVAVLALAGSTTAADAQGRRTSPNRAAVEPKPDRPAVSASVQLSFSDQERTVIREYYGTRFQNLPPGLRRNLARGKALPPGWQKKLEPFPAALEARLTPLPSGHRRGVIDGHAVIYLPGTAVVIDAAVLF